MKEDESAKNPKYIVIYDSPFEQDFEYCQSIELAKQYIEDTCISEEELRKVRVFKIDNEIDVKELGINIKEIWGDIFSEVHKTTNTLKKAFEEHDEKHGIECAAKKLAEGKSIEFVKEAFDLNDAQVEKIKKEVRIESAKGLIEYGSDDEQISRISKLTVEEVKKLRKNLEKNLESYEEGFEERLNERTEAIKENLKSLGSHARKKLRPGKKVVVITEEELEQRYGYTKEHQALDELYFDTSLTKEERLELFQKISPETLEAIPDADLAEFGFKREELKKRIESGQWVRVSDEEEIFDLLLKDKDKTGWKFKDEGVSEEFKEKVKELDEKEYYELASESMKDLWDNEENDIYNTDQPKPKEFSDIEYTSERLEEDKKTVDEMLKQEQVEEEYRQLVEEIKLEDEIMDKRIRMAGEYAMLQAKIHGTYVVYLDGDGDIVREYPDGRIEKIKNDDEKSIEPFNSDEKVDDDEGVSEEFKEKVEELRKKLKPKNAEENPLYQLVKKMVEEDEDAVISKKYQDRAELPDSELLELPPGESIIDYYNKKKK